MSHALQGLQPDAPIETNSAGGRQSKSAYAFHLLPVYATFAAAQVAKVGAEKHNETLGKRNYVKVPTEEHINHCVQHLYAYLAGDTIRLALAQRHYRLSLGTVTSK